MGRKNWVYVSERDNGESKLTAKEEEEIVEEKLRKLSDMQEQKTKKEKSRIVIKCKDCGAKAFETLWNEYGGCPICLDRKKREARAKVKAVEKVEVKKVIKENLKEEQEGLSLASFVVGGGMFLGLLKLIFKAIR